MLWWWEAGGTQELSGAVLFLQGCVAGYRVLEV